MDFQRGVIHIGPRTETVATCILKLYKVIEEKASVLQEGSFIAIKGLLINTSFPLLFTSRLTQTFR